RRTVLPRRPNSLRRWEGRQSHREGSRPWRPRARAPCPGAGPGSRAGRPPSRRGFPPGVAGVVPGGGAPPRGGGGGGGGGEGGAGEAGGRKMIVVLPFENLGPAEDDYFADGLTEAISTRLGSVPRLGIIARQSAMQYKRTPKSPRQIGDELGVRYILSGTVR